MVEGRVLHQTRAVEDMEPKELVVLRINRSPTEQELLSNVWKHVFICWQEEFCIKLGVYCFGGY